ncbi:hypothetical protein OHB00_49840 [Streptomyces sp. NBC_00631]|uniref:hypothetical protein n=1 Tax=Streptomyces sp. NBC_00631 TaxID=2975793 RepID=UPI0030E1E8C9
MTSISQIAGAAHNPPHSKVLGVQIEKAKRDVVEQRSRVKKLRRERRLAVRREAAVRCRTHTRRGLFWIGNTAFVAAMVCFASGLLAVGFQLAQFAFGAWVAALQLAPQP